MCQKVCRVLKDGHTLSCAQNKTHSKPHAHGKIASLPCASPRNTRQKPNTRHITIFVVCRPQNTRQTSCTCHSRAEVANGGGRRGDGGWRRSTLPCAAWGTRQTSHFAVCYSLAHGKQDTSACAFSWHTANSLKILNFQTRNFFYTAETLLGTMY